MSAPDVHIEGMGWMGSALAAFLDHAGIPFTWHDVDRPERAWPACTGIVYPASDDRTVEGLKTWRQWASAGLFPAGTVSEHDYVYTTKGAPHGSKTKPRADLGPYRIHGETALQVDVPTIVTATRERHAADRTGGPRAARVYVVAHGFGERLHRWVWGWTVPVRIEPSEALAGALALPPTYYGRRGRFVMAYAYAIPGRPGWFWAGSSLIVQREPHVQNPETRYARWLAQFTDLFPGVEVVEREAPIVGWRPRGAETDSGTVEARRDGDRTVITVPPLWHSGVRWQPSVAPLAARYVAEALS